MINKKGRWIIPEFLFFAVIISFLCAIIKMYLPLPKNSILYLIIFGIQSMSPTLAAIITIFHNNSKTGIKIFLKSKYVSNISFKLCLLSFFIPMLILIIAKIITITCQNNKFELIIPNTTKLLIIFWALIAEELGWRGFLQEKIEQKIGMIFTPMIVGAVWGLWHYHYFFDGTMDVPFILLVIGCIFESYGYFVITKLAKGNILPASIWHFSGNLFLNIFLLNTYDTNGGYFSYLVAAFSYGFCVIGFLIYYFSYNPPVRPDRPNN